MKNKSARIDRMVTPDHMCPWGLKGLSILKRKGFDIEDNHIESMDDNKAYKEEHGVDETPQIWIEGEHIGGYDDLRAYLGMYVQDEDEDTYVPIIAIFSTTFLMALAMIWGMTGGLAAIPVVETFIALSMCVLGIQKTRDLSSFTSGFLSYDLLARKYVPYAFFYPFAETGAGILMLAGVLPYISAPLALFISTIGAVSVIKAVYIVKRELECACMGGGSNVPLGFISLTENLMMMAMAIWTFYKYFYP